jgi:hypothetical protein
MIANACTRSRAPREGRKLRVKGYVARWNERSLFSGRPAT